jgi:hypothetical protein
MKKMTVQERKKHVEAKLKDRQAIQAEISMLSKARAEYLEAEQKKNAAPGEKALDEAVRGALKEQAARKGMKIPD